MKSFSVVLIFASFLSVYCGIFSSTDDLEALIEHEKILIRELKVFRDSVSGSDRDFVERKIAEHEDEVSEAERDPKSYIYNPLNAYLLIKRLTANFEIFEDRFPPEEVENLRSKLMNVLQNNNDLVGACEGVVRLQVTYHQKSRDFAQGIVDGKKTRKNLTVHDLAVLGRELMQLGYEDFLAIEYLQIAADNFRSFEQDEVSIEHILISLADIHNRNGNYKAAVEAIDKLLEIEEPKEFVKKLGKNYWKSFETFGDRNLKLFNPFQNDFKKVGRYNYVNEGILFAKACRGELRNSPAVDATLHCRYFSGSPYALIGPFKVEEASLTPVRVLLFHDVMFDHEIERLKFLSSHKLKIGTVRKDGVDVVEKGRVTKTAFVSDVIDDAVRSISKRIEAMTNLNCDTAEQFQVQNYGIGGHYVLHHDAATRTSTQFAYGTGNRIATVLFYMSEVDNGGYTVFPYLNIRVPPKKGLGVYWTDLQDTGEAQYYAKHGSCPVLLGSKWVSNKWLHEYGNEFNLPCKPDGSKEMTEDEFYAKFL